MRIQYTLSSLGDYLGDLKATKQNFSIEYTGSSSLIKHKGKEYFFSDNRYSFAFFNFVRKVHAEIVAKNDVPTISRDDIKYFRFNRGSVPKIPVKKAICVDVNSCYHAVATRDYNLSVETVAEINELPKKERLILYGMLATKKYNLVYENGKVLPESIMYKEKDTANFFFHLCKTTGELMDELTLEVLTSKNVDFYGYWFDGIYISYNLEVANRLIKIADSKKLYSKIEDLTDFYDNGEVMSYFKDGKIKNLNFLAEREVKIHY